MPGTVQGAHSVVPTRDPIFGGQRRYVQSKELLINASGAGFYSINQVRFRVRIPSNRLRCIAYITFAPEASEDTTFLTDVTNPLAWLIFMDAWCRLENGKPTRANNIFGTRIDPLPVPNSWESETGVFEWRGYVQVPASSEGGGTEIPGGTLWLTAYWEPAAGEGAMDQAELEKLFNACTIDAASIATTQSGG